MKKILLITATALFFTACSVMNGTDDLTGTWKESNSANDDTWMEATIEDDTVSLHWITNEGDMQMVYWIGTYDAPTQEVTEYTWISKRDIDATEHALFASSDDTKEFTYEDGEINFEFEMLGSSATIRMELEE